MSIYSDGHMYLYGAVGSDFPGESGFDAGQVRAAMEAHGSAPLTVHINSGGGYATEGAAIHAILQRHPGGVDIVVEGIAASAASLIAMSGRTVSMKMGSVLMIHDPAATTSGDSAAHGKTVAGLEALATAYAGIYAAKSGKAAAACRAIMKAETWFTPEEAVAAGFADRVDSAQATACAPFAYGRAYLHTPKRVLTSASKQIMRDAVAETNARTNGKLASKAKPEHPLAIWTDKANARQRGIYGTSKAAR